MKVFEVKNGEVLVKLSQEEIAMLVSGTSWPLLEITNKSLWGSTSNEVWKRYHALGNQMKVLLAALKGHYNDKLKYYEITSQFHDCWRCRNPSKIDPKYLAKIFKKPG